MKPIQELDTWNLPDTVKKHKNWDYVTMPEPTAENMLILLNKINELTNVVNKLLERVGMIDKDADEET